MLLNQNEVLTVSINMQKYGGSFVSALGEALSHADWINQKTIKNAFPEEWEQYLNWGKKK